VPRIWLSVGPELTFLSLLQDQGCGAGANREGGPQAGSPRDRGLAA